MVQTGFGTKIGSELNLVPYLYFHVKKVTKFKKVQTFMCLHESFCKCDQEFFYGC